MIILVYANLVLELVWTGLKSLEYNFYGFGFLLIVNTIWNLVGIYFIIASSCSGEAYYLVSVVNIVVFLIFAIIMLVVGLYYACCGRNKEPGDSEIVPIKGSMEIASAEEQPALEMVRPSDAVVKVEEGKDED